MASCLPLMLLNSPLITSPKIWSPKTPPTTPDLKYTEKRNPSGSIISQQPSRSPPAPQYRRFQTYEHRRVQSYQDQIPSEAPPTHSKLPTRPRTNSAPPSTVEGPVIQVHDSWLGRKRSSSMQKATQPLVGSESNGYELMGNLASSPMQSPPTQASPYNLVDSPLSYTSSPAISPPTPSRQFSRRAASPPSPSLEIIEEDGDDEENGNRQAPAAPLAELQLGGLGISYSTSLSAHSQPQAEYRSSDREEKNMSPYRHSKRVSFSQAEPEVIGSTERYSTGNRPPLKRQDSWSGLFLISAAPIVTHRTPERKPSLPLYRDHHVAGPSILKRKNSSDTISFDNSSSEFQSDMARIRDAEKEAAMMAQQKSERARHWRMRSVGQWVREDQLSAHGRDITDAGIPLSLVSNNVGMVCA